MCFCAARLTFPAELKTFGPRRRRRMYPVLRPHGGQLSAIADRAVVGLDEEPACVNMYMYDHWLLGLENETSKQVSRETDSNKDLSCSNSCTPSHHFLLDKQCCQTPACSLSTASSSPPHELTPLSSLPLRYTDSLPTVVIHPTTSRCSLHHNSPLGYQALRYTPSSPIPTLSKHNTPAISITT